MLFTCIEGGLCGTGPQTDKQMPQSPVTDKFFQMMTFCVAFYEYYLSTVYSLHGVPECLSLRRNWVPPPPNSPASVGPPGPERGRDTLTCRGGGGGTQFGRLSRKPGTRYTLRGRCMFGEQ
jgi:hypothetical protein